MAAKHARYPRQCKDCRETYHMTADEMAAHGKGHKIPLPLLKDFFSLKVGDWVEDPKGAKLTIEGQQFILFKIQRISEAQFLLLTEDGALVMSTKPKKEQPNENA